MMGFKSTTQQTSRLRMRVTRRGAQIVLGLLWLLDGTLQLQHRMFTGDFVTQIIAPAAQGQPRFVTGGMHFFMRVFLQHPAASNALIAGAQLALGALILWKRTARVGLWLSAAWALFVWCVGEGFGGIFGGQTSLLMGAPGAALLYAIIALGVLPAACADVAERSKKRLASAMRPAFWLAFAWAGFWILGTVFQLLPGQNSVGDISAMIAGGAAGAPHWLAFVDAHVASVINGFGTSAVSMAGTHMSAMQMAQMPTQPRSGYWFVLLLALVQFCVGLGAVVPGRTRRVCIWAGIVLMCVFWVVGQNLGEYYSGLATDPNAAPLFILLGLCVLGVDQADQKLRVLYARIERIIA